MGWDTINYYKDFLLFQNSFEYTLPVNKFEENDCYLGDHSNIVILQ